LAATVLRTLRVALLEMKPKLRDILTDAVAHEQDMEIISGPCPSHTDITAAEPDVLVGEAADPLDLELPTRLLGAAPRARVLLVATTGETAALYELRPTQKVLSNVSIAEVIEGIRFGLGPRGPHSN
jgi:hypothetical protein